MPFLATMPTPMIAPRREMMFSRSAGEIEGGDGAEQRQQRPGDDRDRLQERAEFQHQHGEDQQHRHDHHDQQVVERFLLLLIEAAEFDRAGGEAGVVGELRLDVAA